MPSGVLVLPLRRRLHLCFRLCYGFCRRLGLRHGLGIRLGLGLAPAFGLVASACSDLDPAVGPLRVAGGDASMTAEAACSAAYVGSGYTPGAGAYGGGDVTAMYCSVEGGTLQSLCDACEAAQCCGQRVACYGDPACACADQALDACKSASLNALDGAASDSDAAEMDGAPDVNASEGAVPDATAPVDTGTDGAAADVVIGPAGSCWMAFAASSPVAQQRASCLRAACAGVCGIHL